nr:hypothetical protein BaRGS_012239 [Batillaria attramentaria]
MNSDKEKHGMVVLSQVKCSDFNRRSLVSAPDVKNSAEPAEGDFDLMILHRQYGVLIGSIKTASNRAVDFQRMQLDEAITYLDVTERDVKKLVEKVLVEQIVAKLPKQEREILAREIVEKVSQNKPQTDQVLEGRHAESVLEEVSLAVVDQHTQDWVIEAIDKQLRKMIEDWSQIPELLSEVTRLVTCQLYGILTADLAKALEEEVTEYFLTEVTILMTDRLAEELKEQEVSASERILTQLAHGIFQQMSVGKTKILNNLSSIVNLELLQKFRDKLSHTTANLLSHEVVAELMEDTVLAYVSQLPEKTTLHLPENIGCQLRKCVVRLLAKTVTRQLAERVVGQVLESTAQQLLAGIRNELVQARQQISNDFIGKVTDTLFFQVVQEVETDIRTIVEKRKKLFRDKTELSEEDVQQLWKKTNRDTGLTVENTQWVAEEMRRNMQDGETRNLSLLLLRRLTQEEAERHVERSVKKFKKLPSLLSLTKKSLGELSRQQVEKCSLTLQAHVAGRTRQLLAQVCRASLSGSAVKEHVKQVLDEFSPDLNANLSRRMVTELSNHVTRQLAGSDDHRTQSVRAMSKMVFTYLSDESVSRDVAKRLVDLMTQHSVLDNVKRPRILKTVILPHVWDMLLTAQLKTYPELGQDMMPVPEYMQLHQNDQNDHHNDLPDDAMKKAEEWWHWRVVGDGEDANMTDELYRGLVRRPEGEHVYVTCLDRDALAAACLIISQLRQMAPDAAGRIHLLDMRGLYDHAAMSDALRDVVLNVGGKLNIIADEAYGLSKLVGDNNNNNGNFTSISTTASGLSYRDVLVLTNRHPHDEETDVTGNVTQPASGAVTGLRRLGIPVRVVRYSDDEGVREVAEMAGGDVVTVTNYRTVWGLERKVVAVMGEGGKELHS